MITFEGGNGTWVQVHARVFMYVCICLFSRARARGVGAIDVYMYTHMHTHHVEQYKRKDEEEHGWGVFHLICHKFSKSVLYHENSPQNIALADFQGALTERKLAEGLEERAKQDEARLYTLTHICRIM
jgi:hypothetical protein